MKTRQIKPVPVIKKPLEINGKPVKILPVAVPDPKTGIIRSFSKYNDFVEFMYPILKPVGNKKQMPMLDGTCKNVLKSLKKGLDVVI